MKNIKTLALSSLVAHPLFCLVFSGASFVLLDNQGASYKGANLFFVLLFLFWQDLAALVLWHIVASAIDYEGGLRLKHAVWAGVLIPPLGLLVMYFPRIWEVVSRYWAHSSELLFPAEDQASLWFLLLMAPLLGLAVTLPHFFIYRQVFPRVAST